jgi:tetratricopeptide (TPR) repeat protein
MMKKILVAAVLMLVPAVVFAQDTATVRKLFEAGRYQQVVEAAQGDADASVIYTAAQSHQRLGANDQAMALYQQLADRPEGDPWQLIGLSGMQLLQDQSDAALESARRAVGAAGGLADAHYQLALVLAKQQNWNEAAEEFDRTAGLNPSHAYAQYYGGLMHYRANRPDQMAIRFERFLRLAPDAPERPEVTQIMRTVRGR